ncbi:MAG: hypothetical protein A2315_11530 [Ignavibacteria bacterium RIFOXYB2_FULL_35_12]|nr:MAG: hypothetical protein A2058_06990 [Ignavibacteria bacterium GWA2_36_19]OGU56818.1 MAG: hypothetical protein A2X60_07280 [Ignavibacteria bacterium GWF2_35_20]OGU81960.1 MAG: hypothetical protein A2254_15835 [Ignavibacteria bacterium RIFOXYA2_FULL_35_9]OGU86989.1 MAG: hypothetical protein A2492_08105 [Ignavibacteria bacterium RIFOXYC12_FULL_35_11]OGU88791.1 MAG: hypothetical protein A3K31_09595 [Ignavibacteria bacterium RIFOXYA12_FULL_35_25]OGU93256.1 MAG: hypothetical protein A2347_01065
MNKKLFQILLVLSIIGTSLGGAWIEYFLGRTDGENVKLEWKTGEEINLKHFVIERKTQNSSYVDLTIIAPKGSNSFYSYIDEAIYKSTDYVFTYRLRIVDNDQKVSYFGEVNVYPRVSEIKRTWGSIKAMFR